MAQQFSIASLNFASLTRATVKLGPKGVDDANAQPFTAVSGLPPARLRVYNAARQQGLVLTSDAPAVVPKTGVSILERARLASPLNSTRYQVQLSLDDIRASASFHDVSEMMSD